VLDCYWSAPVFISTCQHQIPKLAVSILVLAYVATLPTMTYCLRSHSQDRYPLRSFCPAYNNSRHQCSGPNCCGQRSRCSSTSSVCSVESRTSVKSERPARRNEQRRPAKYLTYDLTSHQPEQLEVLGSPEYHGRKTTQKNRKSCGQTFSSTSLLNFSRFFPIVDTI